MEIKVSYDDSGFAHSSNTPKEILSVIINEWNFFDERSANEIVNIVCHLAQINNHKSDYKFKVEITYEKPHK
jgi:hypothetical protein